MTQKIDVVLFRGGRKYFSPPLEFELMNDKTGKVKFPALGSITGRINGYHCPRCNDNFGVFCRDPEGMLYFCANEECLADDAKSPLPEAEKKEQKTPEACDLFHIGNRYKFASLSSWNGEKHMQQAISNWLQNPKAMMVFVGVPKAGKTWLCAAIGNYLLESKKNVRYINVRKFIDEIQASFNKTNGKTQYETIHSIADVDYLIIDDLGASQNTAWQQEVILELIDYRYSNQRPTIIATNLSLSRTKNEKGFDGFSQMEEAIGERSYRRIADDENLILSFPRQYDGR